MRLFQILLTSVLVVPALGLTATAQALPAEVDVLERLESLTKTSDDPALQVLDHRADVVVAPAAENIVDAEVNGVEITVESGDGAPITLDDTDSDRPPLGIELEFIEAGDDIERLANGVADIDSARSPIHATTVIRDDGSVQILTTIENSQAPTEYDYTVDVPGGGSIEPLGDALTVLNDDGEFIGGIAPAWAVDASGKPVPTRYVIEGSTVTQVVEHRADGITYPVVADPWAGKNLLAGTWVNRNGMKFFGKNVYSTRLSTWGWSIYVGSVSFGLLDFLSGHAIIRKYGWNEFKARRPAVNTKSMKQQFDCHVQYGYIIWKAGVHWDLEAARPVKNNWATSNPLGHKCNWDLAK